MPIAATPTTNAEPRIRAAIAQAASRTGIDFGYLYNQARVESSLDPQAKARTSSAAGLFQFTDQTWLETVKAHGADHGAGWAADAIERRGSRLAVGDTALRATIANMRFDPEFASAMAAEFAADNRTALSATLDRDAEPVDLYLAHFLGSTGAASFLTAHGQNPDTVAAPLFPAAAAANRNIFYASDGSARSLGDIRDHFAAKLDGAPPPARPPSVGPMSARAATTWTSRLQHRANAGADAPLEMARIEPLPQTLSLDFAARAYRRLAGIGA